MLVMTTSRVKPPRYTAKTINVRIYYMGKKKRWCRLWGKNFKKDKLGLAVYWYSIAYETVLSFLKGRKIFTGPPKKQEPVLRLFSEK